MHITLITRQICTECKEAKVFLETRNMPFKELIVDQDIKRDEVLKNFPGFRKLPIFLLDNNPKGSYSELQDYVIALERIQL